METAGDIENIVRLIQNECIAMNQDKKIYKATNLFYKATFDLYEPAMFNSAQRGWSVARDYLYFNDNNGFELKEFEFQHPYKTEENIK